MQRLINLAQQLCNRPSSSYPRSESYGPTFKESRKNRGVHLEMSAKIILQAVET